ncbi:MAG TPA: LysR family transcriptional regulator [Novosphingobium sp.]|nr:LysR family transcriptional regulator [Novosphingobium sp.]
MAQLPLDWNDLRFFLAVARSGSTLAASKQLKVSQATVSRRITVLEEAVGAELFSRGPAGYALTRRGAAIVPLAEAVESAVAEVTDTIAAESRRLSGEVRLTTVESAANSWVIPALRSLRETHPGIAVEVITSDANFDLARGEADVALRFGARPTQETLIVRHLTDLEEAFYASREIAVEYGRPVGHADLARYPLVADSPTRFAFGQAWIAENIPNARIVQRVNTLSGIIAAVRAGLGAALLPCLIGDDLKNLVRLTPPIDELSTPCWLVTTDAARRQPHIRAVIDCVVAQIERVANRPPLEARTA